MSARARGTRLCPEQLTSVIQRAAAATVEIRCVNVFKA
jgi:hypothetical protein